MYWRCQICSHFSYGLSWTFYFPKIWQLILKYFLFFGGLNPNLIVEVLNRERESTTNMLWPPLVLAIMMSALILTCVCVWVCIGVVWYHHLDLVTIPLHLWIMCNPHIHLLCLCGFLWIFHFMVFHIVFENYQKTLGYFVFVWSFTLNFE